MTFKNAISWFEIPVVDMARAQKFYETIFDMQMTPLETPEIKMRIFPIEDKMNGIAGALADSNGFHKPSADGGPLIYLNANPDIELIANKIEPAGGKIIVPVVEIGPEYGFMAVFLDTEGNRIALHAVPKGMMA